MEQAQNTVVYGKNAVTELLKSGGGVDTVYLADGMAPAAASYYTALAKEAGAAVKRVHTAKLRALCGTENHQGVAAFASAVEYASLDDLLALAAQRGEDPFLLLADGVEDPHNLGAMIRTALLAGAHGIVIPKRGGAQVTPIVGKTSAGASVVLPVNVEGGLLLMGDVHACQGDGEITGCALECQGTIEARITLLSREEAGFVNCPQVNSEEFIGSVGLPGCADLTAAMKVGYTDLIRRMERDYGIAPCDGYMLLNLAGEVRVGNEMSCLCKIRRDVLKKYGRQEG